ncbi:GreA/GreB family elongation factor [Pseudomonas sp. GWSMS-1]|uniref:GreA/GreB family elongation factor n=1 Tax=Pseudomonas sp. GWSMS-1 TaxID=3308997 RepID=UPI001D7852CC|nr:GreA/GreB family elongation factor [Gammaproteobacteria bacterium]MBU0883397.1 GreA/GreB family elongation factor [Gammaproteobacteria bacterium]MBU1807879.1 GreA/GreB family elongation factor [Gammaproteobacteria bacterium]
MNKTELLQQVLKRLEDDHLQAQQAALTAYETATAKENIAENKYDTLGLEASYLATGQARRAAAIRQTLANWKQLVLRSFDPQLGIQLGALIALSDDEDRRQCLFLGPDGAAMKLQQDGQTVQVIGPQAPLGQLLLGKGVDDEITLRVASGVQLLAILSVD